MDLKVLKMVTDPVRKHGDGRCDQHPHIPNYSCKLNNVVLNNVHKISFTLEQYILDKQYGHH